MSPRNVRNCWVEVEVDGAKPIAFGPKSGGGGLEMKILLREAGGIREHAVRLKVDVQFRGTTRFVVLHAFDEQDPKAQWLHVESEAGGS